MARAPAEGSKAAAVDQPDDSTQYTLQITAERSERLEAWWQTIRARVAWCSTTANTSIR